VSDYEPEAAEVRDSSYYELALTNRQVFAVIVLFLGSLCGAFLAGVWFARDAAPATLASATSAASTPGSPPPKPTGSGLDEYRFFSEQQSEKRNGQAVPAPAAATPAAQPLVASRAGTTLAQDVGARPATGDDRSAGGESTATAPETRPAVTAAAAGESPAPAAGVPATPTPSAPAASTASPTSRPAIEPASASAASASASAKPGASDLWVQVFSSADSAQARRVVDQLRQAGYRGAVSAAPGGSGPPLQRVRIGPYRDREQAQRVADDVRRKLKFSTWITSTQ
jgi:cell division septation protein DedD